jgi:hypothetical protein
VLHYHKVVSTGPLFEEVVRAMSTYRSIVARMQNASWAQKGRLDARLMQMSEHIGELLGQLTDMERSALSCWQDGITPNTYRVDHEALKAKPYVSIRRVECIIVDGNTQVDAVDETDASSLELDAPHWQRLRQIIKRTNG